MCSSRAPARSPAAYQREQLALGADLAPFVASVSPPLLLRVQADGWDLTGWPAVPGRPWADLNPGSADIPKVTRPSSPSSSQIPAPGRPGAVIAREYWAEYTDDPGMLDGDALVHPDPNPANFIIDGDRTWIVDCGWAVRGPAWMTAANLIALFLMEAGLGRPPTPSTPSRAVPAWAEAPPSVIDRACHLPAPRAGRRQQPGNRTTKGCGSLGAASPANGPTYRAKHPRARDSSRAEAPTENRPRTS